MAAAVVCIYLAIFLVFSDTIDASYTPRTTRGVGIRESQTEEVCPMPVCPSGCELGSMLELEPSRPECLRCICAQESFRQSRTEEVCPMPVCPSGCELGSWLEPEPSRPECLRCICAQEGFRQSRTEEVCPMPVCPSGCDHGAWIAPHPSIPECLTCICDTAVQDREGAAKR